MGSMDWRGTEGRKETSQAKDREGLRQDGMLFGLGEQAVSALSTIQGHKWGLDGTRKSEETGWRLHGAWEGLHQR